ncbi:hypothetical protein OC842_006186 [Tilletia horrida]|uniref:Uncharacterized protein n=1 Tax=Tilletia horrida TaxID=155126 RepID=A0AAN6JHT7_9BASI|nr:hypothetical protein OC842_006186 [Tilletia horrida]
MPSIPPGLSSGLVAGKVRAGTPYPTGANNSPLNTGAGTAYNPFVILDSNDDDNLVAHVSSPVDVDTPLRAPTTAKTQRHRHGRRRRDQRDQRVNDEFEFRRRLPAYTELSFRERMGAWLQAYSIMPTVERRI